MSSISEAVARDALLIRLDRDPLPSEPDPLLTELARLLADPRVPDAYAESVRACIREHCYQLRLIAEKEAA